MTKTFKVSETTLVFAFRYALGRHTGATTWMVGELRNHWSQLTPQTQRQIQSDITFAMAGGSCEAATWQEVLTWRAGDTCPACEMAWHNCLCSHDDERCGYVSTDDNAHS